MKIFAETERLILREILPIDAEPFFEMDSDPEVHKFLGTKPVSGIEEIINVIRFVQQQYIENGIGRWAIIEKSSGQFMGWTGLKLMKKYFNNQINFHDLGYRLLQKHWGKGYATESANASLQYAFEQMKLKEVIGMVNVTNTKSNRVLEKCGMKHVESFSREGVPHHWLKITQDDWLQLRNTVN
ncbi:MAG: GNAT family N-acetyltransferase [Bacteroidota bacterium]